ncbi:MAG: hypothetical protein ACAH59_10570 [Pseudobdellovibrionaceae bacterium]
MPAIRFNYLNLLLVLLMTLILCGAQTTFWFQIFGSLPAPLLWLNLVLYLILYRKPLEGIATIYLVALFLRPFSAMPLGVLWLTLLIVFSVMSFVKKRVFWPGSRYFLMASFGIGICYHLAYFIISKWFESNPATVSLFHRFFEIVFTALTSIPLYIVFAWMDRMTNKETLPESGGLEA